MTLLPRTLFWRAFLAQMLLMGVSFGLVIAFISRDHARLSAENVVAAWVPALKQALAAPAAPGATADRLELRVVQDVVLLNHVPPPGAFEPFASARFQALRLALQREGVDARRVAVSGVTDDSVIWLQVQQGDTARWIGVSSNLEGEDLAQRAALLLVVGLGLAATVAAALSRMVARPTRQLAQAVRAFGLGQAATPPVRGAPAEIEALARTVAQTFEQRRELDAQRELMLAGLSHDVRSPLTRIRLAADLLPDDGAEIQDLKQRIGRNVVVLDRLIGSFADYVRAEHAPLDRPVDLAAVAREAAASFGLPLEAVHSEGDVQVLSSGDVLRRALDNLIDNALRYGQPPLQVAISRDGARVQVVVSNAGDPVDAGEAARLRLPFERGEQHRGSPGTGLGLAIVERVARRHGGSFDLLPTDAPRGTRAVLWLQARAADAPRAGKA